MKADINSIVITKRIRKEVLGIEELAEDIVKHGMLNPITVMSENSGKFRLLAGLRRLEAARLLNWEQVDVNIISPADAEAALLIEISENEQREPFTYSEKMDFARLLEEIETAKARERMVQGGKISGNSNKNDLSQGRVARPYPAENSKNQKAPDKVEPTSDFSGRSRDAIGGKIGMSGRTYERAKFIQENAPEDVIDRLDKGETSIYKEYNNLRSESKNEGGVEDALANVRAEDNEPNTSNEAANKEDCDTSENTIIDDNGDVDDDVIEDFKGFEPSKVAETPKNLEPSKTQPFIDESKHLPPTSRIPKPLSKADEEAQQKIIEFNALPAEKKVDVLQEQILKERARAAEAESKLKREQELHHNTSYHSKLSIANLENQIAVLEAKVVELSELLDKAGVLIGADG